MKKSNVFRKFVSVFVAFAVALSVFGIFPVEKVFGGTSNSGKAVKLYESTGKSVGVPNDLYNFVVETNAYVTRIDFWYHLKNTDTWVNAGKNVERVYMTAAAGKTKWVADEWRLVNPNIDRIGVTVNGDVKTPSVVYNVSLQTEAAKNSFNGHTYQIIDKSMSWTEAKAYCEKLGGYLATITSAEEQKFVESITLNGQRKYYWLGGTDEKKEGEWEWITGERFDYRNFSPGQPDNNNRPGQPNNNRATENYLHMYKSGGKWNDHCVAAGATNGDPSYPLSDFGLVCEWNGAETNGTSKQPNADTYVAPSINNVNYPSSITKGNSYTLSGTINAGSLSLERVYIGVRSSTTGQWLNDYAVWHQYTSTPAYGTFDIKSKCSSSLHFEKLPTGSYTLRIAAVPKGADGPNGRPEVMIERSFVVK